MQALVTGAAGFLGRALCRELLARGHAVRALLRARTDDASLDAAVERVRGDATDAAALARAVRGCDLVYHLAGVRRAVDPAEFMRVNAGSTRLLLDACASAGAARQRFVLAGSLAAIGPSREGRREEDPFAPAEPYGASKAEAERIAMSFAGRLPVAVGRPPRIFGPGDRENLLFFRIAARGLVLRFGGGERPLSWVDVDDCAEAFALLGERDEAVGQAFNLGNPQGTATNFELANMIIRLTESKSEIVFKPHPGPEVDLRVPSIDKAATILGFKPTVSLEAGISNTIPWYREHLAQLTK